MSMKTKNGRAVKTSAGVVYVAEERPGKRRKWHRCGELATREGFWSYGEDWHPLKRDAAIWCAEAFEREQFDGDGTDGQDRESYTDDQDRSSYTYREPTVENGLKPQDDEGDAEAYANCFEPDQRRLAYDAFLEGRRTAR